MLCSHMLFTYAVYSECMLKVKGIQYEFPFDKYFFLVKYAF